MAAPDLNTLVSLFFPQPGELGEFEETSAEALPPAMHRLLAHHGHMTETVEAYHRCPVTVEVLSRRREDTHYARKILLRRSTDQAVVQFGIVRLDLRHLSEPVRREIESEKIPLGRVLINHHVMREVELSQLWKIQPGPELQRHFSLPPNEPCYGRTALIWCNGEPAVELLEIVIGH